jgi:hypothetical protein
MLGTVILKKKIESMNSWRGKHDIEELYWKYSIQNETKERKH